ncbi:hypothetical protein [Enterovirga sp.]|jgi:hypothetical protein|uniref:hypothetical protein n=1 Tax=Enterovirga sp. TaxID=2026350 RepID=UPI00260B4E8D|nr:hypothetical protein [Enterovirga sp.]MDB5589527.1 hypothetical protein [Enterovirga sp.]
MPHLDASALSTDPEGMDLLRDLLDVPSAPVIPVGAFEVKVASGASQLSLDSEVTRPRRLEFLSELA